MQLLQGNLGGGPPELIASFKQVAVGSVVRGALQLQPADTLQVVVSPRLWKKAQCEVDIQCDPKLAIYSLPSSFTQNSNLILNSIHHGFDGWDGEDHHQWWSSRVTRLVIELIATVGIPRDIAAHLRSFRHLKRGPGWQRAGTHIIYNLVVQLFRGRIHRQRTGPGAQFPFSCPSSRTEPGRGVPIMLDCILTSGEPRNGTAISPSVIPRAFNRAAMYGKD